MKSNKQEILKKDIDWLWRAISYNPNMGNEDSYVIRISDTSDKIAFVACVAEE